MQPRFFNPTYPVDDFSSSKWVIYQSLVLFVLHEACFPKSWIYPRTIFRLLILSLESTAKILNAAFLDMSLLHLGLYFWLIICIWFPDLLGTSNRQSCKMWGTSLMPTSYFLPGYFWSKTFRIYNFPFKMCSLLEFSVSLSLVRISLL